MNDDETMALAKLVATHVHCAGLYWRRVKRLGGWSVNHEVLPRAPWYPVDQVDDNVIWIAEPNWHIHFRQGDTNQQCRAAIGYKLAVEKRKALLLDVERKRLDVVMDLVARIKTW